MWELKIESSFQSEKNLCVSDVAIHKGMKKANQREKERERAEKKNWIA